LEVIRNLGAGLQQGISTTRDDSSNVIRLRPPEPSNLAPMPDANDVALVELLTVLNGQSLQSAFTAMDVLQFALDQVEATHATLPDNPEMPKLRQETARLSCELFAVRMVAVRLSSTLAQLRQALPTLRDDRTAGPALALRLDALGN
jgi:hypothetical protein